MTFTPLTTCNTPCACRNPLSLLCNNWVRVCVRSFDSLIDWKCVSDWEGCRTAMRCCRISTTSLSTALRRFPATLLETRACWSLSSLTLIISFRNSGILFFFFFSADRCVFFVFVCCYYCLAFQNCLLFTASSFIRCFRISYLLFGYSRASWTKWFCTTLSIIKYSVWYFSCEILPPNG